MHKVTVKYCIVKDRVLFAYYKNGVVVGTKLYIEGVKKPIVNGITL